MKNLYIVRHSKAVEFAPDYTDFNRCLADSGVEKATLIAEYLFKDVKQLDLILSSPACRALETAQIFAMKLNYPIDNVEIDPSLYHFGGIETVMDIISEVSDTNESLMLVGHNPTFNALAWHLCPEFRSGMPTSAVVALTFKTNSWSSLSTCKGRLLAYLTRKSLN
ncbi:MAG: phosphohistidine phosphatase SixA [Candidatus Marinimicrobia bacterium]|nr:phosphohistidine phosphatase SixA [Candidatus Neomarinimicrobiota bacterium]